MDKWLYRISMILVVIGLIVSVYMTIYKATSNDAMCLGSGDCSTVNASRYSEVYGIPVASVGIAGYFAILLMHWYERRDKFFEKNGPMLIFGMALDRLSVYRLPDLYRICRSESLCAHSAWHRKLL